MGEIAEMMTDGTLCQVCGCELGSPGDGYPRTCSDCSEENDADMWKEQKAETKERHAIWWMENSMAIKQSRIPFRVASRECYVFREVGKPKVDFYPSTGRWRNLQTGKTFSGGATAFIIWYKKQ